MQKNHLTILPIGLICLALFSTGSLAQTPIVNEDVRLLESNLAAYNSFGTSVDVSGSVAVIGASGDDENGENTGAAYVYELDTNGNWLEKQKLVVEPGFYFREYFGHAVSIDHDRMLISAPLTIVGGQWQAGVAYIFEYEPVSQSWTETAKLVGSDVGQRDDRFGSSVDLEGDLAVVGNPGDSETVLRGGAVYLFARDSEGDWNEEVKLTPSEPVTYGDFGYRVAISDNIILVSANTYDENFYPLGAVYVFVRDQAGSWNEEAKLESADIGRGDRFGWSVDMHDNTAVIGANQDVGAGAYGNGAAYVFLRDGSGNWIEQSKLTASDGGQNEQFGYAVAINGNTIVVSAQYDQILGPDRFGSAYIFNRVGTHWSERLKFVPSDLGADQVINPTIGISGSKAIVGYRSSEVGYQYAGSAYVFDVATDDEGPVVENLQVSPNPALEGSSLTISADIDDTNFGFSVVSSAEYRIGDLTGAMSAIDGTFDGPYEEVQAVITSGLPYGMYEACVAGTDELGNRSAESCATVTVQSLPTADAGPDIRVLIRTITTLDGSSSSDPDGTLVDYSWNFGDGLSGSGAVSTHSWETNGVYTAMLAVTDNDGLTASDSTTVTVITPAEATQDLLDAVIELGAKYGWPPRDSNQLQRFLSEALIAIRSGDPRPAEGKLKDFIKNVNRIYKSKRIELSVEEKEYLIQSAEDVSRVITL